MGFNYPYTYGYKYDNVNGKDMVPGGRHWNSTKSPSGCSTGGGHTNGVAFLPQWGASGAILTFYGIGMGGPGTTDSQFAVDLWDISAQAWQGEYVFPRSTGPTYSSNASSVMGKLGAGYSGLADVGDSAGSNSHWERHQYHFVEIDKDNYIWICTGGHYGASTSYGYCYPYIIKSTKPYTDSTWNYSGAGMWKNMGAVHETATGAYNKIITDKCTAHSNRYYFGGRKGTTYSDWQIWYSDDGGESWNAGAIISKDSLITTETYGGLNLQYIPQIDRTLLFWNWLPTTAHGPGHGWYWMDCYQMSANKWAYASSVSPKNYDYTVSGTYSGSKWPLSPSNVLSFDKVVWGKHPGATWYDYKDDKFYIISPAGDTDWTTTLYLYWKSAGTTDSWASAAIITADSGKEIWAGYNKVSIVSGNNNERYMFVTFIQAVASVHNWRTQYYAIAQKPFSSQSSWSVYQITTSSGTSGFDPRFYYISDDKYVIVTGIDKGTTTTW